MSEPTTKTYYLDEKTKTIHGYVYGSEAMKQGIKNILLTQRYAFEIYSQSYGCEIQKAIGKNLTETKTDTELFIEDALLADDRIKSVDGFEMEKNGGRYKLKFNAVTADGLIHTEEVI